MRASSMIMVTNEQAQALAECVAMLPESTLTVNGRPVSDELRQVIVAMGQALGQGDSVTVFGGNQIITAGYAAELLGVSRPTMLRFVQDNRIPCVEVGGRIRFRAGDVFQLAEELRQRRQVAVDELTGMVW